MSQAVHMPATLQRVLAIAGLAWALATPLLARAEPEGPVITILDGSATVLDGIRRMAAAPGLPLAIGSIIETAPATQVLRIEWPGGETVNLGPDTRVMLSPPGFKRRGRTGPALYLLQGWVKHSGPTGAQASGLVAPAFEIAPFKGVIVARVGPQESWLFVQSGSASLSERQVKSARNHELAAGNLYERVGESAGSMQPHASSARLREVPRAFRDTLPSRYAQAVAKPPEPVGLPTPTYGELQPWLTAETPVRAGFTRRFIRLLRDRDFRRDLDAQLAQHEEWRPILHPPPPPPPPPSAASGAVYRPGG